MKTLFINPGGIGDQILLLGAVKLFKEKFPDSEVDLITEPRSACVGELTNLYRKIKEFNFKEKYPNIFTLRELIRRRTYKYLFCSGYSYKANFVASLANAEIKIGFKKGIFSKLFLTHPVKLNTNQYVPNTFALLLSPVIPEVNELTNKKDLIPEIKISLKAIEWVKETLAPKIKERYYANKILIHPGVSKLSNQKKIQKSWPTSNWAKLIELLVENQNNTVILVGGKEDIETINEIHKKLPFFARPKNLFDFSQLNLSLEQLAGLIHSSDLLVCVDSAPMHIAVGLGRKLVAFFGPTDPKRLLPNDPRFVPVYREIRTLPECLDVTLDMMLGAIKKQLEPRAHGSELRQR